MTIRVAGLFVHPIKSAASIEVDELALDLLGAVADRRWLVIDADGDAITSRETPALALVRPEFADPTWHANGIRRNVDGALLVHAPSMTSLRLDVPPDGALRTVRVWGDELLARDCGDAASLWMSDAIGRACRVVRIDHRARRPLREKYAGGVARDDRVVAFSDGAPLLILGQASIDALNERLVEQGGEAMDRRRFRPNVLLRGSSPHEEDTWRSVIIGDVSVGVGEPCSRCVMTTIEPTTGERGVEPLRTLATYRRQDGQVMFGMNATNATSGTLRVGDAVRGTPK